MCFLFLLPYIVDTWPLKAAWWSGVPNTLATMHLLAPFPINSNAASVLPFSAVQCSEAAPLLFVALMAQPALNTSLMTSRLLPWAAACKRVAPLLPTTSTGQPVFIMAFTDDTLQHKAAWWSREPAASITTDASASRLSSNKTTCIWSLY